MPPTLSTNATAKLPDTTAWLLTASLLLSLLCLGHFTQPSGQQAPQARSRPATLPQPRILTSAWRP